MTHAINTSRVYMLASDHRWQWEEWCDGAGVPRERISEIKSLVLEGFVRARASSADVRAHGALLLDNKYGTDAVARAKAEGIPVGTPVEKAGVFPLEWEREPFHALSAGNSFTKVLIRYRPEWPETDRRGQLDKLLQLQDWCGASDIPLLVEIIIMRSGEDEHEFEERGRPQILASVIQEAYRRGLVPSVWKIEGTRSREGARIIDDAIRERPEPRQLILGKGADPASIASWFEAAAALPSTAGFAIGRSVFMDPATAYLAGTASSDDAIETIASRYLALIEQWKQRETMIVS
jgi:5-dehydro-2-deoxygluconokinase